MSDINLSEKNSAKSEDTPLTDRLKDQVSDAGAQLRERAGEALRASSDVARDKAKEATEAVKGVASGAMDQVRDQVDQKQQSGADFIQRFAGNMREAARAFETDAPLASRGINAAADYVEGAGEQFRQGSFRDLLDNATDFAKRQPAAFLGLSVLAGFATVRFLKASDGGATSSKRSASQGTAGSTSAGESGTVGPSTGFSEQGL